MSICSTYSRSLDDMLCNYVNRSSITCEFLNSLIYSSIHKNGVFSVPCFLGNLHYPLPIQVIEPPLLSYSRKYTGLSGLRYAINTLQKHMINMLFPSLFSFDFTSVFRNGVRFIRRTVKIRPVVPETVFSSGILSNSDGTSVVPSRLWA